MAKTPPNKPYPDYPLHAHASGQWARSIRGTRYYFGVWADWEAALRRYQDEKDDLYAGRTPSRGEGLTVLMLCNQFLTSKHKKVDAGELTAAEWNKLKKTCERVRDLFGRTTHVANLRPVDFENLRADFAKTHGAVTLSGDITRVKSLFNYCEANHRITVWYGDQFEKPTVKQLRRVKEQQPKKLFTEKEIHKLLAAADKQLAAMIMLGINCAFGNDDIARLTTNDIDLRGKWVNLARHKTGVARHCPLWVETVAALKLALVDRPEPKDANHADHVFITTKGTLWTPKSLTDSPVSNAMAKLLDELGIRRRGVNFYSLRHTFNTQARDAKDRDAIDAIMGHREQGIGAHYNEAPVSDERLKAVSDHVHDWLYANSKTGLRRRR